MHVQLEVIAQVVRTILYLDRSPNMWVCADVDATAFIRCWLERIRNGDKVENTLQAFMYWGVSACDGNWGGWRFSRSENTGGTVSVAGRSSVLLLPSDALEFITKQRLSVKDGFSVSRPGEWSLGEVGANNYATARDVHDSLPG